MTKHLASRYRDPRILPYELGKLTPMDLHADDRWKTRDLPRIASDGLWYPLALYKVSVAWWNDSYRKWMPKTNKPFEPIVNEDGMIWAIKMGSNRYQSALYLGYDSIDAIMFDDANDCVKWTVYFRERDPLNNVDAGPFLGTFDYRD